MTPEDLFLEEATRGLRGATRTAAIDELRSHLHERAQHLVLEGVPAAAARAQAIRELGSPRVISRGLNEQHGVHPGIVVAAFVVASVMTVATGLSLSFNRATDGQPSALEQLFSPDQAWRSPCEGRARCVSIDSQEKPTVAVHWYYGLVPLRQAPAVFDGTDVRVTGLFRKVATLPGFPAVPLNEHLTDVGWEGRRSLEHDDLNLPELLLAGSQQGWPVRIDGTGDTLRIRIQGKALNADSPRLASATVAEYLRQQMNRQILGVLRLAAVTTQHSPEVNLKPVQAVAMVVPRTLHPKSSLIVTVPRRIGTYALIRASTPFWDGEITFGAELAAFSVLPDEHRQIHIPVPPEFTAQGRTYELVGSQAHFLNRVRAGVNVAMLVEVPRDLQDGLKVVALQEQSLRVQ